MDARRKSQNRDESFIAVHASGTPLARSIRAAAIRRRAVTQEKIRTLI